MLLLFCLLTVSNGFCTDTSFQTISLANFLKADFTAFEDNCPNEPVNFISTAQGIIVQHNWDFGDGSSSSVESPTHIYSQPYNTSLLTVRYTISDSFGCQATTQKFIKIYSSCYVTVPNAFTPNNDGKNDLLRVLNAVKAEKFDFRIYNRWGQLMFQTTDWKQGWDGTVSGKPQGTGTFIWLVTYTERNSTYSRTLKGTAVLIR